MKIEWRIQPRTIGIIILVLSALWLFSYLRRPIIEQREASVQRKVFSQSPALSISAQRLYGEYKANEVAADELYKGKILRVSGVINKIGKDITDTIYITLKGDRYFGDVQCLFGGSYRNQLASLSRGQAVAVRGRCSGKMINVLLGDCALE